MRPTPVYVGPEIYSMVDNVVPVLLGECVSCFMIEPTDKEIYYEVNRRECLKSPTVVLK